MKKSKWAIFLFAAVFLMFSLIPTFAVEQRASEQLSYYYIDVTSSDKMIDTDFTVRGTKTMDKIGCEGILIYEKSGSRWVSVASFDEDDADMSVTRMVSHSNTISWACKSGVEYRVDVTIFAENSAGRDTRSKTVYVTGK